MKIFTKKQYERLIKDIRDDQIDNDWRSRRIDELENKVFQLDIKIDKLENALRRKRFLPKYYL